MCGSERATGCLSITFFLEGEGGLGLGLSDTEEVKYRNARLSH